MPIEGSKEQLIARVWQSGILSRQWLPTDSGEMVQAIYPGYLNRDDGPDFRGAIVMTSQGRLLSGDVELHFNARDWKGHGHDRDAGYNRVVLQVTWDGPGAALLQNGRVAPTVRLGYLLRGSVAGLRGWAERSAVRREPCYRLGEWLGGERLGRLLDKAGEQRFRLKVESFRSRLSREPAEEVIYQGMMKALGYSRNGDAMEELARRLPPAALGRTCRGHVAGERLVELQAILLGTAGLLARHGGRRLEAAWRALDVPAEPMDVSCWRLRGRPANSPLRRLEGAAHLIDRFLERGFEHGLLDLVRRCPDKGWSTIEEAFVVAGPGDGPALVGRDRAREIAVNIVLPLALACSGTDAGLADRIWWLYRSYPGIESNHITRRLKEVIGGDPGLISSARRLQGLIHLDKTFCEGRGCFYCPLAASAPPSLSPGVTSRSHPAVLPASSLK